VTFGQPTSPHSDAALARAIQHAGNVVLGDSVSFPQTTPGSVLKASHVDPVLPAFAGAANGIGHVDVFPDTDGVTRALAPFVRTPDGGLMPSLSMAMYERAARLSGPVTVRPDGFRVGTGFVHTGPGHLMDVNTGSIPED